MSPKLKHFLIHERWSRREGADHLSSIAYYEANMRRHHYNSSGLDCRSARKGTEQPVELIWNVDNIGMKICGVLQNEGHLRGLSNKDHIYHLEAKLITAMEVCTLINLYLAPVLMAHFQNRQCWHKNYITYVQHFFYINLVCTDFY